MIKIWKAHLKFSLNSYSHSWLKFKFSSTIEDLVSWNIFLKTLWSEETEEWISEAGISHFWILYCLLNIHRSKVSMIFLCMISSVSEWTFLSWKQNFLILWETSSDFSYRAMNLKPCWEERKAFPLSIWS